jgi:hypothetical protein
MINCDESIVKQMMRLLRRMNEFHRPFLRTCSEPSFQESICGLGLPTSQLALGDTMINNETCSDRGQTTSTDIRRIVHHQSYEQRHRAAQRGRGRCGQQYVSIMPSDATKRVSHAAELALAPWQRAKASSPALPIPLALHVSCCCAACMPPLPPHQCPARAIMPRPHAASARL